MRRLVDGSNRSTRSDKERELRVWIMSKLLHKKKIKRKVKIKYNLLFMKMNTSKNSIYIITQTPLQCLS